MILVLAGNKEEFDKFLERHEPKNIFLYVSEEEDYAKHKNCDLVLVGSYKNNPLWKDANKKEKFNAYYHSHGIDIVDQYAKREVIN